MDNVFTDKNGREIVIDYDNLDIVARHGFGEVGRLEFLEIEGDHNSSYLKLMRASVKTKYQRAGIGVEMMRHAVNMHGEDFSRPGFNSVGGSKVAASEYYTEEGAALIRTCIRLGVLNDKPDEEES